MPGAYLEIDPQETYTFTANVLLNDVPQDLSAAALWFQAISYDYWANSAPFINASTFSGQVSVSNGVGSTVASLVTVALASNVTANLQQVNCGQWSLVARTQGNVYKLDGGRIAVRPNIGFVIQ